MPTMTTVTSVAANTRTANLFAGQAFEFVSQPSIIRLYATGGGAGMNLDFLVGGESILSDTEISEGTVFPTRNQDLIAEFGGLPGDRILVTARNTTVGALTVRLLVDVLPV